MDNDIIPVNQLPNDDVIPVNQLPQGQPQQKPQIPLAGMLEAAGVGTAVGGLAYGGAKAYDYFRQPQVRQELQGYQEQIKNIQKQIPSDIGQDSMLGTTAEFTKKKLGETATNLKGSLNAFDDTLVSLKAKDLSENIKQNYSSWMKGATDAYGQGLDSIDVHFNQSGKTISTKNFADEVLEKTMKQAESKGILPAEYSTASKLKSKMQPSQVESGLVDIYGKPTMQYEVREMPFSEAKGYISSLVAENPYSATSGMLRENWGKFLEKTAPEGMKGKLGEMNKHYRTFSQAREQLSRVVDPKTGEFNTAKLNNYLTKYTKQRVDDGIVDLMQLLGEGSELTKPMSDVKGQFGALTQLKNKRFSNVDAITAQIEKVRGLQSKVSELAARASVAKEQLDSRSLAKALVKTFGLGKKAMGVLSSIAPIMDAVNYAQDPEAYMYQLTTGGTLGSKGSEYRKIQLNQEL